jgi:type IV secretion system protein VirB6
MGIGTMINDQLTMLTDTYVSTYSGSLSAALVPFAVLGVTIYLLFQGWAIARGHLTDTLPTLLLRAFRIAFIAAIALGSGLYNDLLVGSVAGLQNGLIEALTTAPNMGVFLDEVWQPYRNLGIKYVAEASTGNFFPTWSMLGAALLILAAGVVTLVIALGYYVLCKLALALLFGVGPLFILCAIWPSTQRFAESWLSQTLNYVMLSVLATAATGMVTQFGAGHLANIQANGELLNVLGAALVLDVGVFSMLVLMLNLNNIATALTGGIGLQGIGREVAQFIVRTAAGGRGSGSHGSGGSIGRAGRSGSAVAGETGRAIEQASPSYLYQQGARQVAQRS